jgi:ribonucleoside-triphosphate reductase (thioredoxin)
MNTEHKILSDITVWMKYAKYNPEKQRRETWKELVDRNKEMHLRKFPEHTETIERAYQYVYDKKILPSMRSLQFGGKPIELNNTRLFNCSYLANRRLQSVQRNDVPTIEWNRSWVLSTKARH